MLGTGRNRRRAVDGLAFTVATDRYASFLPAQYRTDLLPTSTMWLWRDISVHITRAGTGDAPRRHGWNP